VQAVNSFTALPICLPNYIARLQVAPNDGGQAISTVAFAMLKISLVGHDASVLGTQDYGRLPTCTVKLAVFPEALPTGHGTTQRIPNLAFVPTKSIDWETSFASNTISWLSP
jgi:hypothetical protein